MRRWWIAIALSFGVTLGLFVMMSQLVKMPKNVQPTVIPISILISNEATTKGMEAKGDGVNDTSLSPLPMEPKALSSPMKSISFVEPVPVDMALPTISPIQITAVPLTSSIQVANMTIPTLPTPVKVPDPVAVKFLVRRSLDVNAKAFKAAPSLASLETAHPTMGTSNVTTTTNSERGGSMNGVDSAPEFTGGTPSLGNNELAIPLRRIEPRYPIQALQQGIQGYVLLSFTIDSSGKPIDIRIVSAKPRRMFERAAIQALKQWRYQPKKINGVAIEQQDQTVKLEFRLNS